MQILFGLTSTVHCFRSRPPPPSHEIDIEINTLQIPSNAKLQVNFSHVQHHFHFKVFAVCLFVCFFTVVVSCPIFTTIINATNNTSLLRASTSRANERLNPLESVGCCGKLPSTRRWFLSFIEV